ARGQLIGDPSRAVGRVIVDDEDVRLRQREQDGSRDRTDVVGLVVRGQNDPGSRPPGAVAFHHREGYGRGERVETLNAARSGRCASTTWSRPSSWHARGSDT